MTTSLARALQRTLAAAVIGGAVAMVPVASGIAAPAHTVDLAIVAGKDAGSGGMDFNGYRGGGVTITVPVGWRVVVHFTNAGTIPHSVAVLPSGAHQQPAPSGTPVFADATTGSGTFVAGLPVGAKQTFTFEASKPGTYEFVCGCPAHALAGMWAKLIVSPTADGPSVTPAGAAAITGAN